MRFLIFGDVVGRPGREAVSQALPQLREEYQPDSVIINIENLAHGAGISPETWAEAKKWQADVYTTGDHAWDNAAGVSLLEDPSLPIIRPANYPDGVPGRGWHFYTSGAWRVAVINLQGQLFFRNDPDNPFRYMDAWLQRREVQEADIILVDFQAEATSEKRGLSWYLDGRVTALWGTHTHVPTADAQILPEGTGYITDLGMNASHQSVIGIDRAGPVRSFVTQLKATKAFDDGGPLEVGALLLEVDGRQGVTTRIVHIRKILNATGT
jgi:metallophosphoesterase (TIGR00282 family)